MEWIKIAGLLALISACSAVPIAEDQLRRRAEGVCDSSVMEAMAQYDVDTSRLRCFTSSQERGLGDADSRKLFRRSCCVAECAWMANELGVEPSSLICPT